MKTLIPALLLLTASALAEAPKITVVHTGAIACAFVNSFSPGTCRQSIVVIIESKESVNATFLVGIRYIAADGTETLEARYPVKPLAGGEVWFFIDNVHVLSATAASMKTNEVGIWHCCLDQR